MTDRLAAQRAEFWAELAASAPEIALSTGTGQDREVPLGGPAELRLKLKLSVSQDKSSVYLVARSQAGQDWIAARAEALARSLLTQPGHGSNEAAQNRWFRKDNKRACVTLRSQWPEALRWFRAQHTAFDRAVRTAAQSAAQGG